MNPFVIRTLATADRGYVLSAWRSAHKQSPKCDNVPWSYYKYAWGTLIQKIVDDPATKMLGAYADDKLLGFLVMSPGKRVHTLHWVGVKFELDGEKLRRRGLMTALLEAADLGSRFIYTLHARRDRAKRPDGTMTKSLDETLVQTLADKGVVAVYNPLKEWLT
mgnify:FL=1